MNKVKSYSDIEILSYEEAAKKIFDDIDIESKQGLTFGQWIIKNPFDLLKRKLISDIILDMNNNRFLVTFNEPSEKAIEMKHLERIAVALEKIAENIDIESKKYNQDPRGTITYCKPPKNAYKYNKYNRLEVKQVNGRVKLVNRNTKWKGEIK